MTLLFDERAVELAEAEQTLDSSMLKIDEQHWLDTFPLSMRDNKLKLLLSKLKYGGEISFQGTELTEVIRASMNRELLLPQTQAILYKYPSLSSIFLLLPILESYKLQIITKRINFYEYYVEASRPLQ
jgi:hypothetical protein